MKKQILFFCLALTMVIGLTSSSTHEEDLLVDANDYRYQVAKEVFNDLIQAKGDKRMQVPEFIMKNQERYVAWMNGKKGQIGLEAKAYDICVSFGADSLNAIAALLGHEITHYYEKHDFGSQFASAYTDMDLSNEVKSNSSSKGVKAVNETEADYLGGFLAHSAGYNTFGIMPEFLSDVYKSYGLSNEIPGYPSLDDRAKLAVEAEGKMQELVGMYQTANHLVVLGKHEDADKYFNQVLKVFQSREIYNNAGVNATLAALALVPEKEKESKYAYPLQLDGDTRMDIKIRGEGGIAFGDAQRNAFNALLEQAVGYFEQAKALDKTYGTAYLNLACAYDLKSEHEDAIYWAKKAARVGKKSKNTKVIGDAKILTAISSFHLDEVEEGKELLEEVEMAFAGSKTLAQLNLAIQETGTRPVFGEGPKEKVSFKPEKIDGISLSSFADNLDYDKDVNITSKLMYAYKNMENSRISIHIVNEGESITLIHITDKNYTGTTGLGLSVGATKEDLKAKYGHPAYEQETRAGQYIVYKKKKVIFYIKNGRLDSWATFQEIEN